MAAEGTGRANAVVVDHVTFVGEPHVPDGFGAPRPSGYLAHLGARSHSLPLAPPAYLEWLVVDDPTVAARTETGRRVLATRGIVAWTVRVNDIEAVSRRVGVPVFAGTTLIEHTGVVRRWWTVTGSLDLPVFIAYDGPPEERVARWQAYYDDIGHACAPRGISRVEVGGDADELAAWLGPHDLPVAVVGGPPGILAVYVETATGVVAFR